MIWQKYELDLKEYFLRKGRPKLEFRTSQKYLIKKNQKNEGLGFIVRCSIVLCIFANFIIKLRGYIFRAVF